jgi:hypothetical protein
MGGVKLAFNFAPVERRDRLYVHALDLGIDVQQR